MLFLPVPAQTVLYVPKVLTLAKCVPTAMSYTEVFVYKLPVKIRTVLSVVIQKTAKSVQMTISFTGNPVFFLNATTLPARFVKSRAKLVLFVWIPTCYISDLASFLPAVPLTAFSATKILIPVKLVLMDINF